MEDYNSKAVKKIRKAKNFTQEYVAQMLDMPLSTYSLKERGGGFSDTEITALLKVLKTTRDHVFTTHSKVHPTVKDVDAFIISNQVRQEAMLQVILELLAREEAKASNRDISLVLSDLQKAVSNKEEALRDAVKKSS